MIDRARARLPWLLVAGSGLLLVLLLYVLFAAFVPARQRAARLDAELRDVYAREAALQTRLDQQEQRHTQQLNALTAERDTLARRLDEAQRELARRRR